MSRKRFSIPIAPIAAAALAFGTVGTAYYLEQQRISGCRELARTYFSFANPPSEEHKARIERLRPEFRD